MDWRHIFPTPYSCTLYIQGFEPRLICNAHSDMHYSSDTDTATYSVYSFRYILLHLDKGDGFCVKVLRVYVRLMVSIQCLLLVVFRVLLQGREERMFLSLCLYVMCIAWDLVLDVKLIELWVVIWGFTHYLALPCAVCDAAVGFASFSHQLFNRVAFPHASLAH